MLVDAGEDDGLAGRVVVCERHGGVLLGESWACAMYGDSRAQKRSTVVFERGFTMTLWVKTLLYSR